MSVSLSRGQTAILSLCIHADIALRCKIRRSWRRGGRARCPEFWLGSTEALLSGIVSDLESPWSCSAGYEELSCEEDDCRRGGGEKTATAPAWRSRGKERRQGPMLALLKIGNWETVGAERRRRERNGRGVARRWTVEERVSQSDKRDELGLRRERCNV